MCCVRCRCGRARHCHHGTGKAFCAGGDIRAMKDPEGRKAPAVRNRMRVAHACPRALLDCDTVIAAVNGAAAAARAGAARRHRHRQPRGLFHERLFRSARCPTSASRTLPWAIGSLRAKDDRLNRRYTAERRWRSARQPRRSAREADGRGAGGGGGDRLARRRC
jgi:hypothetical protein